MGFLEQCLGQKQLKQLVITTSMCACLVEMDKLTVYLRIKLCTYLLPAVRRNSA
jgi:hypothetical protein